MFEILEKSSANVIGIKVHGKLVHEDYAQVVPKLEQLIEQHGSIRCYCELTDFHGITPHALWDELKFDTKHCRDIERCAMVGDPSWHQWMSKIGQMIFSDISTCRNRRKPGTGFTKVSSPAVRHTSRKLPPPHNVKMRRITQEAGNIFPASLFAPE